MSCDRYRYLISLAGGLAPPREAPYMFMRFRQWELSNRHELTQGDLCPIKYGNYQPI